MVQVHICHMHILCLVHVVSLTYMYSGTTQSGHSEVIDNKDTFCGPIQYFCASIDP